MGNRTHGGNGADFSFEIVHNLVIALRKAGCPAALLRRAADNPELIVATIDAWKAGVEKHPVFYMDEFLLEHGVFLVGDSFKTYIAPAWIDQIPYRGLAGIQSFELMEESTDIFIINREEFGGMENARKNAFTPDQLFQMYNTRALGVQEPYLQDGGYVNIFYVIGVGGLLYAVTIEWDYKKEKWMFEAAKLQADFRRKKHCHVFYNPQK